jgi:hypothetical protein
MFEMVAAERVERLLREAEAERLGRRVARSRRAARRDVRRGRVEAFVSAIAGSMRRVWANGESEHARVPASPRRREA